MRFCRHFTVHKVAIAWCWGMYSFFICTEDRKIVILRIEKVGRSGTENSFLCATGRSALSFQRQWKLITKTNFNWHYNVCHKLSTGTTILEYIITCHQHKRRPWLYDLNKVARHQLSDDHSLLPYVVLQYCVVIYYMKNFI